MPATTELGELATGLRLAAFDVDGVMTDGRLAFDRNGEAFKSFHVRDGLGLKRLRDSGVEIAVITGRKSEIVSRRMEELGVRRVHQGVTDKRACIITLIEQLGLETRQASFMGDDLPDVGAMEAVGLPVAVADACAEVRGAARLVTQACGGAGAVREFSDLIVALRDGVASDPQR